MPWRSVVGVLVGLLALSLVAAPATMGDWGEQATFFAQRIDEADADERTPVIKYQELTPAAKDAVRPALESPGSSHTVYGREDWPDRFFYSDYSAPGRGRYVFDYGGEHYRLTTHAGGGFPFVYWFLELPFVLYGLLLGSVAFGTVRAERSTRTAAIAAVPAVAFHLLGPEFDFPLLSPGEFVRVGLVAVATLAVALGWEAVRARRSSQSG